MVRQFTNLYKSAGVNASPHSVCMARMTQIVPVSASSGSFWGYSRIIKGVLELENAMLLFAPYSEVSMLKNEGEAEVLPIVLILDVGVARNVLCAD